MVVKKRLMEQGPISKRTKVLSFIGGLVLIGLIFSLDYMTRFEVEFSLFYLLPIALVIWYNDLRAGLLIAVLGAVGWLLADLDSGLYHSHFIVPYWNAGVRLVFFVVFVLLVHLFRHTLAHEMSMARVDFVTGLPNLNAFFEIAGYELERTRRSGKPLTLAYFDLDNFKRVNDTFGHRMGNELLRWVADTMEKNIRATDTPARLGGDEFVILMPETEEGPAMEVLRRLQDKLSETTSANEWPITTSTGVVTFSEPPESVDEMISKADKVMYSVKHGGKNSIRQVSMGSLAEGGFQEKLSAVVISRREGTKEKA